MSDLFLGQYSDREDKMKDKEQLSNNPVSRANDLESSKDAERHINKVGSRANQQKDMLALVRKFPGKTSLELALFSLRYDRYQIARRLSDLHHAGLVKQGQVRPCNVSGRKAVEWIMPKQVDLF